MGLNSKTEMFNQGMKVFIIKCKTFDIINHKGPKQKKETKFSPRIRDNGLANNVEKIQTTVHRVSLISVFLSAEKLLKVLNSLTT